MKSGFRFLTTSAVLEEADKGKLEGEISIGSVLVRKTLFSAGDITSGSRKEIASSTRRTTACAKAGRSGWTKVSLKEVLGIIALTGRHHTGRLSAGILFMSLFNRHDFFDFYNIFISFDEIKYRK